MQPARRFGIAHRFLHRHRERNHVVPHLGFQLINSRHVDTTALTQL